jgi:tetratricopeptide (TPR) repeat protein
LLRKNRLNEKKFSTFYFTTIINICNIYDSKNEYEKSIFTLNKLILEIPKDRFPREYFKAINNLAYSKMKLGNLENVESQLQSSLDFAEKENNKTEILYIKLDLGEFYLINKDTAKAKEYLNESFTAASTLESNKEILRALKLLAIADKKNSSVYKGKYIVISDELAKNNSPIETNTHVLNTKQHVLKMKIKFYQKKI